MKYWLTKTEPEDYSIDDLMRDKTTLWTGVRNYQARNFLIEMQKGDKVLIYHSNSDPSGVVGVAVVNKSSIPDPLQFEKGSDYYDNKASLDNPRWFSPELKFAEKFKRVISLNEIRECKELSKLMLLQKGSRLSVQPVTKIEFEGILRLL